MQQSPNQHGESASPAARLTVELDPATRRALSRLARRHGVSVEEELARVVQSSVAARGPGETPTGSALLAGFERFREAGAASVSLDDLRRLRARQAAANAASRESPDAR